MCDRDLQVKPCKIRRGLLKAVSGDIQHVKICVPVVIEPKYFVSNSSLWAIYDYRSPQRSHKQCRGQVSHLSVASILDYLGHIQLIINTSYPPTLQATSHPGPRISNFNSLNSMFYPAQSRSGQNLEEHAPQMCDSGNIIVSTSHRQVDYGCCVRLSNVVDNSHTELHLSADT